MTNKFNEEEEEIEVQATFRQDFTIIQNYVHDCMSFQQPIDKLVYMHLLRFAFHKGSAYPTIKKLCFMCGKVSHNTVRSALKRLEEMKLIKIKRRKNADGTYKPNMYYINDLTDEMKKDVVSDYDTYWKAVEEDNLRKKMKREKAKKEKEEAMKKETEKGVLQNLREGEVVDNSQNGTLEGTSNFEVLPTNNDVLLAKFDTEEEPLKEEPLKEDEIYNNQSISQSIKETKLKIIHDDLNDYFDSVPTEILKAIQKKTDRLIYHNISVVDIVSKYDTKEKYLLDDDEFKEILLRCLNAKKKIENFHNYFKSTAINNRKERYRTKDYDDEMPY